MTVKSYLYNDITQLTTHFNVKEFRCKCGKIHDTLISVELARMLEKLYAALNCSKIIVNSGYRCASHDKTVGGTGSGQHTKGRAADVVCYGQDGKPISSKIVCCTAQDLGFGGIANITGAYTSTHLDVRTGSKYYGDETKGTNTVTSDFYNYFGIAKSSAVDNSGVKAYGIDVSKHQGTIDWDKVKTSNRVDFAILRAGYGREYSQIDQQFERNYSECKRLGIPCGAYWYSYATTAAEAKREAAVCLSALSGKSFEYPIAFDIEEEKSLSNADALCMAFCDALEAAGYYVAIYTFKSALECNLSDSVKSKYDIFLSHVGVSQTTYAGKYGLWQYSWKGSIPGVFGDVDLDYAYKDYPTIIKSAGLNGFGMDVGSTESGFVDASKKSASENLDTLKRILEHIESIDEKLRNV